MYTENMNVMHVYLLYIVLELKLYSKREKSKRFLAFGIIMNQIFTQLLKFKPI